MLRIARISKLMLVGMFVYISVSDRAIITSFGGTTTPPPSTELSITATSSTHVDTGTTQTTDTGQHSIVSFIKIL